MKCLILHLMILRLGKHQAQSIRPTRGSKVHPLVVFPIQTVLRFILHRLLTFLEDILRAWLLS